MLLHSAAGMHNHEYSHSTLPARPRSDFMPKRSPLNRSSFSNPGPEIPPTQEAPIPALLPGRSRALSEYIPRKLEHQQVHAVRFQEPEADTMSEDGRSVANSEGSRTTNGGRRRRRSSKASTAFRLAHPAPTLTHKQRLLNIRPKLLMQLQLLSSDKRPKPTLDVLPSTVVVSRLAKRFPRMFRGKGELGANDIMIVKSEEYDIPSQSMDDTDSDEEGFSNRDLIAVICQMPKDEGGAQGKAEIVLGDGSVWLASPLPTGAYEMTKFDESGGKVTTIRWVKRAGHHNLSDSPNNDTKFTFSIIDPNSRRHPILATITQTKLDIPDYYTLVCPSPGIETTTAPVGGVPGECDDEDGEADTIIERTPQLMDETMRTLIQVTGIWVSLRQGWSPYFKYNDAMATFGQNKSPRNSMNGRTRASSLTPDLMRSAPVLGGLPCTRSSTPESTFGSIGDKILRGNLAKSNSVTISSPHDSVTSPRRARATSTGTAFMQRAASRKINTIASDSEGESVTQQPESCEGQIAKISDNAASNRVSCPPRLGAVASPSPILTKPHRRVKSTHMFSNKGTQNTSNGIMDGQSGEAKRKPTPVKRKNSRWRSFINFVRGRSSSSRSPSS
ncbi:hypothetical protein MFRU_027g01030 [Monilinia fructicola]|uniref:Uncharacterized protein n=3 Tax=Monilinia fructicola TaxID=38448 RepID=A0A5M9JTU4_MONFR|nr:hypothetical protein EYC84_003503 [Monilinia fructicola]KAG4027815.1 hypothetical protein MFRU_027g01030 [Monilinia fructicola]